MPKLQRKKTLLNRLNEKIKTIRDNSSQSRGSQEGSEKDLSVPRRFRTIAPSRDISPETISDKDMLRHNLTIDKKSMSATM